MLFMEAVTRIFDTEDRGFWEHYKFSVDLYQALNGDRCGTAACNSDGNSNGLSNGHSNGNSDGHSNDISRCNSHSNGISNGNGNGHSNDPSSCDGHGDDNGNGISNGLSSCDDNYGGLSNSNDNDNGISNGNDHSNGLNNDNSGGISNGNHGNNSNSFQDACDAVAAAAEAYIAHRKNSARQIHPVVQNIYNYIAANYSEDISLKTLSRRLHFSPSYLGQIFKQHTGRLFSDYLCEYRIRQAKELLARSTYKSRDIAAMVGFQNANYFANVFRKMTGVYPTVFRKEQAAGAGAAGAGAAGAANAASAMGATGVAGTTGAAGAASAAGTAGAANAAGAAGGQATAARQP
jgi:AraC-like DNA-binding protein